MTMMRYLPLLALLTVGGLPSQALAQRVGDEFMVNTFTTGFQNSPSVASDAAGNFVVVWTSGGYQDGDKDGIFGQRYDSGGNALGGEFQVNTHTRGDQLGPAVASDAAGNFVVVWTSDGRSGGDIFGQRYDNSGNTLGGQFQVNTYFRNVQYGPAIASDAAGNFVVVWGSHRQDGDRDGVFGQRYDSGGNPLGGEFQVNTYTTGSQASPSVASDAAGNFVVVWTSGLPNGDQGDIWGQRYDSSGNAMGEEFQVNTYTTGMQRKPAVALDAASNFVVIWGGPGQNDEEGVFGQRYDSDGVRLGNEFKANTYPGNDFRFLGPSVASDATGTFVVAWQNYGQDGSQYGVFGQRYDSSGHALGGEFQVNTYTTRSQRGPSIAFEAGGDFVVVWSSLDQTEYPNTHEDLFGQRFVAAPTLSVSDVSVNEGDLASSTGGAQASFMITLSAASAEQVTVDYATADGTARTPSDYLARSGVVTFQPSETSKRVAVIVKGDTEIESDETFFLNLSNPMNAAISDGQGVGTISNDDP